MEQPNTFVLLSSFYAEKSNLRNKPAHIHTTRNWKKQHLNCNPWVFKYHDHLRNNRDWIWILHYFKMQYICLVIFSRVYIDDVSVIIL